MAPHIRHHEMFINGKHVDSPESDEIRDPATGEVFATIARGDVEHADAAVSAARTAFEAGSWSRLAPADRSKVMREMADRIGKEFDELVDLEIHANGATVRQATAFHIGYAAPHLLHFAELADSYQWERQVPTQAYPTLSTNVIRQEPLGVCAAIVPWNFPLLLGIWKIGPALAAGNSVVVKPDEKAPLTLLRLCEIAQECGVPDGVINLVTGPGPTVGARLAEHPDVDKVAFTGSTPVGREIMRLASGTVKRISLELGGKGAQILLDDANLDVAIDGALFGCMLYSGQICESGTRLLVPDDMYDLVVDRLVDRASALKLGDTTDFDTDVGPLISARQRDRVLGFLDSARASGAKIVLGGGVPHGSRFAEGYWIEPTIVTEVSNDMEVAREEIFGPVLCVLRYADEADAVRQANDTQYGLSAGVWSTDYERAIDIAAQLRAGTVWINNWHQIDAALPFGGFKQSGVGRELGEHALDEYTETKHVHIDLTQRVERHIFGALLSEPLR
ncbi:aldehyde dehydrogenase [Mycolicibacterium moriokaense]|jgi:acyl-CoA reductase-like NAD-dependent aldehyde dehydrogenase|uniref:Aldehyde dehydrogenase n=1 Tax=Mycolicibacterium moriokaense TaxID=39691 RepID=A0AAD1HCQ0_9MYCO|nr:aldehyde dehydrogenase family protein [Mycolicibacterium moriokaense]MCV7040707.1 aldehyde dehydrogenase [Mycolicibacterium moriokaense]ORB26456.1 aldehyde dehydrogenase [Mycolicibacterium moriokaense]BBX02937.1 aldehyde dehydrogenase [Mycolicibacterium moriokaense]